MKKWLFQCIVIGILILLILCGEQSVIYGRQSLLLCYEMIIPTLFPFFVCTGLLIHSGFCGAMAKLFAPVMRPVFGIHQNGSAPFVLGLISGYPLGALTACQLYQSSYLTKEETERLMAFCNNSGPLFILGSVGAGLYGNVKIGALLYGVHILAALTVGVLFRFFRGRSFPLQVSRPTVRQMNSGEMFSAALSQSVSSILTVCGAVLFFGTVSRLVVGLLPTHPMGTPMLYGFLEFATGCAMTADSVISLPLKLILSSFVIGFGGISVHLQVLGVVAQQGISMKFYWIGKLMHGGIAAAFMTLALRLFAVPAFAEKNAAPMYEHSGWLCAALVILMISWMIGSAMYYTIQARRDCAAMENVK